MSPRPLSILVTGGAGFIGSHLVEALVAAGHRVVVLDDLSSGHREQVPAGAELHALDVRSPQAAELAAELDLDVLVHLAAQTDVRRSVGDPRFDADVNVMGTLNLLEAMRRGGSPGRSRRVLFASTGGAIYGEQETHPADENHPTRPVSPYGVSKLAVERYLYTYHLACGWDVVSLRYANVYGARQSPHGEAGVVAIFLDRLLRGEAATINGDGGQTRDYVHVADVVAANLAVLEARGFHVYNVGTGLETSVVDLYRHLAAVLGVERPPLHEPAKPGEQRRSAVDPRRLERELGVRPAIGLREGLVETARWFRERRR